MRNQMGALLASLGLACAAIAQTESQPSKPTDAVEKLWKIESSGLSG